MDSIAVAYSVNVPGYPELPQSTIEFFRDDLFTEYEIIDLELAPFYGTDDGRATDPDEIAEKLADCVGIFAQPAAIDRTVIEAAPRLRVIATMGSGYERIDVPAATEHNVVVVNNPEVPAPYVAEYTVMAMIALLREIDSKRTQIANGIWEPARTGAPSLRDSTVGLVGLGNIGLRVAKLLEPFDTDVYGFDPYATGEQDSMVYPRYDRSVIEDAGVDLVDFETVLSESSVVSLHIPSNEETHHLIGRGELDTIGDGYLVNTSRGPVVDEAALIEALDTGRLRGAAIDVFQSEPPDQSNPLLSFDNVIATPHISGIVAGLFDKQARAGAEKIGKILDGETVDTVVNPDVLETVKGTGD